VELLRPGLRGSATVTDAAFEAGYGSVRGFYEQAGRRLGMDPSRYAAGGAGEHLVWSAVDLANTFPVGTPQTLLAVVSYRGVVAVRIGPDQDRLLTEVAAELPQAVLHRDDTALPEVLAALAALARGVSTWTLPLDVRGIVFQAAVWSALRAIPAGQTRSYTEVAERLGRRSGVRAVARACATS